VRCSHEHTRGTEASRPLRTSAFPAGPGGSGCGLTVGRYRDAPRLHRGPSAPAGLRLNRTAHL